jgi:hypothetical protein
MYQEIVVSPTVFKNILDSPMDSESLHEILSQLATEEILSDADSVILDEYRDNIERDNIELNQRLFLQNMFSTLVQRARRQKDITVQIRKETEYNKYETEIRLAKGSDWKIIICAFVTCKKKEEVYNKYNIEISDLENYVLPKYTSKIRALEKIELRPGDNFDLKLWIEKYLRDAKRLIIKDRYMCSKDGRDNLFNILSCIDSNIEVALVTLSDKERNRYNKNNDGIIAKIELDKIIKELLIKNYKYKFVENRNSLLDRHLETDKFDIDLGHAIVGVNPKTNVVVKQFRMIVTKRKKSSR